MVIDITNLLKPKNDKLLETKNTHNIIKFCIEIQNFLNNYALHLNMDRRFVKQALIDQRAEIDKILAEENIIERENLDEFTSILNDKLIKVITGVRRCGKSVFSHLSLKTKNYAYTNFDDERLIGIETKDLNILIELLHEIYGEFSFILLDEIQNIPNWELFANRLLRQDYNVIITGSNSSLLSRELASRLTGRCISFKMYPFSFREYLTYFGIKTSNTPTTKEIGNIKHQLSKYISLGGFPESYKVSDRRLYLRELYDMIISRDIVERYNVKFVRDLREIASYLISNFSSTISYNKLRNIFKIKSVHTIKNYISYIEDAYLVIQLFPFSRKIKHQLMQPKKIYCIDTGLIESINPGSVEDIGKIMENIVAIDLLRRENRNDIYFYHTPQQYEVDFLIKKGQNIKELIQVTYAASRNEIDNREIRSLIKASEQLGCKSLKIITWDYEDKLVVDNKEIECIPLWKWLIF